jgi:hypothetical protein
MVPIDSHSQGSAAVHLLLAKLDHTLRNASTAKPPRRSSPSPTTTTEKSGDTMKNFYCTRKGRLAISEAL